MTPRHEDHVTDYASFAPFYDRVIGDRSSEIARILGYLDRYRPDARSLLELGCGTGAILAGFAGRLALTGIDRSPDMLAIAAGRLPGAELVQADMTAFQLQASYDAVLCVFDTLNHLPSFDLWLALFDRAHEHLADHGLLIFDVNTTGRLRGLWGARPYQGRFDGNVVVMDVRQAHGETSLWTTTIFETNADGTHRRHTEHILELGVPLAMIRDALSGRFELLEETGLAGEAPTDESDRVFFACRKRPRGPAGRRAQGSLTSMQVSGQ
jgi:SAM-dependent methyltransferase